MHSASKGMIKKNHNSIERGSATGHQRKITPHFGSLEKSQMLLVNLFVSLKALPHCHESAGQSAITHI